MAIEHVTPACADPEKGGARNIYFGEGGEGWDVSVIILLFKYFFFGGGVPLPPLLDMRIHHAGLGVYHILWLHIMCSETTPVIDDIVCLRIDI